jgi:hypothetical protein
MVGTALSYQCFVTPEHTLNLWENQGLGRNTLCAKVYLASIKRGL